jgi:putative membrane protein
MAEVELANLAQQKAQSADVKSFAAKMAQDHGAANSEFAQLLTQKGASAPAALDKEHADVVAKLTAMSGADFDKEYMKTMVADHDKTVALFETESKDGKDADMKNWATAKLPTLKDHQKMAKELAGKLK